MRENGTTRLPENNLNVPFHPKKEKKKGTTIGEL